MSQAGPVVFVLDDDVRFVTALSSLLRCNGFTTRTFTSVDDFLKDHDLDCPGCLILDVRMPGVTGLELQNVLAARGITRAAECGPGKVLIGLLKRIERTIDGRAIGGPAELAQALADWKR